MKIEVNVTGTDPLVKAIKELAIAMSNTSLATKGNEATVEEPKVKEKEPTSEIITLEQVRAKLAALSQSGHQKQVKALLKKYDAKKLSEVPVDKYPDLLKDAEEI